MWKDILQSAHDMWFADERSRAPYIWWLCLAIFYSVKNRWRRQ